MGGEDATKLRPLKCPWDALLLTGDTPPESDEHCDITTPPGTVRIFLDLNLRLHLISAVLPTPDTPTQPSRCNRLRLSAAHVQVKGQQCNCFPDRCRKR